MTALIASAPGKVVLCGEYAVLDGAPAISMAVNRRALVTLIPVSGDGGTVKSIGLVAGADRSLFDSAVRAAQFEKAQAPSTRSTLDGPIAENSCPRVSRQTSIQTSQPG